MDFEYFVKRYAAFVSVTGMNAVTRDLAAVIAKARESPSGRLWRSAAARLMDLVPSTDIIVRLMERGRGSSAMGASTSASTSAPQGEPLDVTRGLKMGRSRVFMRAPVFEYLERTYSSAFNLVARRVQVRWKAKKLIRKYLASTPTGSGGDGGASKACMVSIMYFCDASRRKAVNSLKAAIVIQRRYRAYRTHRFWQRVLRGCVLLQARARGRQQLKRYRKIRNDAATTIQALVRGRVHRARFVRWRAAARKIQHQARRFVAQCYRRRALCACRRIQATWRGTSARLQCRELREKMVRPPTWPHSIDHFWFDCQEHSQNLIVCESIVPLEALMAFIHFCA